MLVKNPLTPAGIKPATFRFVAQHLNHCATAVPILCNVLAKIPVKTCSHVILIYQNQQTAMVMITVYPSIA